jgi:hypothetical protein
MRTWAATAAFLLPQLAAPAALSPNWAWVHTPSISAAVDLSSGQLAHVNSSAGYASDVAALSYLGEGGGQPSQVGAANVSACEGGGAVCVVRQLTVVGQKSDGSCCVNYTVTATDTFAPALGSIAWTFAVLESASGASWRTSIVTSVAFAAAASNASDALVFAPRAAALNGGGFDDTTRLLAGADPALPLKLQLGRGFIYESFASDYAVAPLLASVTASLARGCGVALFHDPSDALVAATAEVGASSTMFSRIYNRLGAGAEPLATAFTVYIVSVPGRDWRPAFAWARSAFPRFFLPYSLVAPPAAARRDLSRMRGEPTSAAFLNIGLGLYTCADASELDAPFLRNVSATHIWDAHFFWPYQGMFLPPNNSWTSNLGDGEELDCGAAWAHGSRVDRACIAQSYVAAEESGLATLSYLNLFHFGKDVRVEPSPQPPTPTSWTNSSLYIAEHFSDAVLPGPVYDWQNSVVLDPTVPDRAAFLSAQIADKVASFGAHLSGVVIDEIEPTKAYNMQAWGSGGAGWGTAWCGQPCRFLLFGWRAAAQAAADALHADSSQPTSGGRVELVNFVGAERIDVLESSDGVFSEDYVSGGHRQLLSATGISTTGKTAATIWTYSWAELTGAAGGPDAFMQEHLFFKAFPMAPAFGADHSISNGTDDAGAAGRQLFLDYGALTSALVGGCWHLAVDAISVAEQALVANAFTVGGGCTAPEIDNGNGPVDSLVLFAWAPPAESAAPASATLAFAMPAFLGSGELACETIVPGAGAWSPTAPPAQGADGRWRFASALALGRGCIMTRCSRA